MAEGFRFMPLGLVRLRTFRLSTWVSLVQTWVQVLTRVRGGCVVHWCQNKNPIERLTSGCEWRHAPEARTRRRIWGFWKSQFCWVEFCLGRRRLTFACLGRVPHEMGGIWKSQNRKNVYLSPYVEEPLNSKVIKSFVPELRSRYVFFVFRDSYVLCIYVMNILCTFHVAISWLCNRQSVETVQCSATTSK